MKCWEPRVADEHAALSGRHDFWTSLLEKDYFREALSSAITQCTHRIGSPAWNSLGGEWRVSEIPALIRRGMR